MNTELGLFDEDQLFPEQPMRLDPSAKSARRKGRKKKKTPGGGGKKSSGGNSGNTGASETAADTNGPRKWPWLAGAGVAAVSGLIYLLLRKEPPEKFADVRGIVEKNGGSVVFDKNNGTPKRCFVILKQYHGGDTSVEWLTEDATHAQEFFDHHDAMTRTALEQLRGSGPDGMRIFIEGFAGPPSQWDKGRHEMLQIIAELEEHATGVSPERAETIRRKTDELILREIQRSVESGNLGEATSLMYQRLASYRIAAICLYSKEGRQKGWHRAVQGADIIGGSSLSEGIKERLDAMVMQPEMPSDQQIRDFINWTRAFTIEQINKRHEYDQRLCEEQVPEGGTGYFVMGGYHMASGAYADEMRSDTAGVPLEEQLLQINDARTIAVDPKGYEAMIKTMMSRGRVGQQRLKFDDVKRALIEARKTAPKTSSDKSSESNQRNVLRRPLIALSQEFTPKSPLMSTAPRDEAAMARVRDTRFRPEGDIEVPAGHILIETTGRPLVVPKTLEMELGYWGLRETLQSETVTPQRVEVKPVATHAGKTTTWLLIVGGIEVCLLCTDAASTGGLGALLVTSIKALTAAEAASTAMEIASQTSIARRAWDAVLRRLKPASIS